MSIENDLMQTFNFTESDLVINRQGQLTHRQKHQLRRKQLEIGVGYGIVIIGIGAFLFYLVLDTVQTPIQASKLLFAFLFGIMLLVGITFTVSKLKQYQQDIEKNVALKTHGKASLGVMETRNLRYKLQVNELELEIPRRAYNVLSAGKIYRVYYTPKSKFILSIETSE